MALIRQVVRHENSRQWAYVEYSDEDINYFLILGGKEFYEKEEVEDYSKGFETGSYVYVEPLIIKRNRLTKEKERIETRLRIIYTELKEL